VGGVLLPPGSPGVHTTYTSTSTLPLSPSHHQVPAAQPVFLQPSKPGSASSKSVGVISAHMEVVKGLVAAGEELRQAERGYVLPEMAHAETQVSAIWKGPHDAGLLLRRYIWKEKLVDSWRESSTPQLPNVPACCHT
jgi:hypothetical protein